jgi:hypothetical protein
VWRLRRRHEIYSRVPWLFGPLFLAESPWRLRAELAAALPDAGYDGRAQFAAMLPLAALFSGILSLGFVGLGALSALLSGLMAGSPLALVLALLLAGPPLLWLGSFFFLQKRRRAGWRMFALASVLATLWALWSLQIFQLAFDLLFVYAAIQARDAYRY